MNKKKETRVHILLAVMVLFLVICFVGMIVLAAEVYTASRKLEEDYTQLENSSTKLQESYDSLQKELEEIKSTVEKQQQEAEAIRQEQEEAARQEEADRQAEAKRQAETENQAQEEEAASEADGEDTAQEETAVITPGEQATVSVAELEPGTIVDETQALANVDAYFQAFEITEGDTVYNRINGKSYRENENIGLSQLRYLKMIHYNFSHEVQVGEMIVNEAISEDVLNIFKELLAAGYEVESMYLVDNYWTGDGDSTDSASIEVNNTSCFNYRQVTGGGSLSNHAYGCAIDINPQQNPYVWYSGGQLQWSHSNASDYIDRTSGNPHVIVAGDTCYSIFEKYGFSWGGNWSDPIDYQHFEKKIY